MKTTAIAQHLNIASQAIIEIQEWATVLWVRFVGGCKFVSKKVIKAMEKGRYAVSSGIKQPALFVSNSLKAAKEWANQNDNGKCLTVWATSSDQPYRIGQKTLGNRAYQTGLEDSLIF